MKCKKCRKSNFVKAGFVKDKQRYKCKECNCFFTDTPQSGYPTKLKLDAIKLYLEGLGFRAIGRFLKVSNVAVMKWVKSASKGILSELNRRYLNDQKVIITTMELDEMWHYVNKKNKKSGSGWMLTEIAGESLHGNLVVVERRQEENYGRK